MKLNFLITCRSLYAILLTFILLAVNSVQSHAQNTNSRGYQECVRLQEKVDSFYNLKQLPELHVYCDSIMAAAEKYGLMQYYYNNSSTKSLAFLQEDKISEAFDVCEKTLKKAYREKDDFGIFISRIMMARFYNTCKLNSRAVDECMEAAEIEKTLKDHKYGTAIYLAMLCCQESEYWQKARNFLNKYHQYVTDDGARISILGKALTIDFWLQDSVQFKKDKEQFDLLIVDNEGKVRPTDINALKVIECYENGDYSQALELVENVNLPLRYTFKSLLFHETQQRDSLLSVMQQRNVFFDNKAEIIYESDVRKFEAELMNQELITENLKLEESRSRLHTYLWIVFGIACLVAIALGSSWIYTYVKSEKRLLDNLKEKNALLERMNSLKSIFVQNMGHEVRTPLNAICGFSQLLADPELADMLPPEERKRYGEIISSSTEMLNTLVSDILDLGDIESGKYRINKSCTFINEICNKSINTIRHRVPDYLALNFESEFSDTDLIYTDPARVQQILVNFLTNAIKHTDEGSITLSVNKLGTDEIRFSVADTGEGIPADKAEAIFERFEKLNTTRQGTGLGLPICRSIAGCLGGKVYLDTSYKGPGSRFHYEQKLDDPENN